MKIRRRGGREKTADSHKVHVISLWCARIRMPERVLRVSQLDATELDDDLLTVLQQQLLAIFKLLPSTRLLQFKPELRAALKALLWWYSVRTAGQTFGQGMLDIQYSRETTHATKLPFRHRLALLVLSVGLEWLGERFHLLGSLASPRLSPRQLETILGYLSAAVNTLSLLNFTVFLLRGNYPTLQERLVGLLLSPTHPQTLRNVSYDYMNREILWHGFSEFLFFVLPHFNVFAIRNWLHRVALSPSASLTDYSVCVFCEKAPTRPTVTQCGHVYCHYCLQANCMADSHFPCSVCGQVASPPHAG